MLRLKKNNFSNYSWLPLQDKIVQTCATWLFMDTEPIPTVLNVPFSGIRSMIGWNLDEKYCYL